MIDLSQENEVLPVSKESKRSNSCSSPPSYSSKPLTLCKLLYTDISVQDYAIQVAKKVETAVAGILVETVLTGQMNVPKALEEAENGGVWFGLVVNFSLYLNKKIELVVLQPQGPPTEHQHLLIRDDYDIEEAIEKIQQELNKNAMKEEESDFNCPPSLAMVNDNLFLAV